MPGERGPESGSAPVSRAGEGCASRDRRSRFLRISVAAAAVRGVSADETGENPEEPVRFRVRTEEIWPEAGVSRGVSVGTEGSGEAALLSGRCRAGSSSRDSFFSAGCPDPETGREGDSVREGCAGAAEGAPEAVVLSCGETVPDSRAESWDSFRVLTPVRVSDSGPAGGCTVPGRSERRAVPLEGTGAAVCSGVRKVRVPGVSCRFRVRSGREAEGAV